MRERKFDYAEVYELRYRHRVPVATLAVKFGVGVGSIRWATEEQYRRLHRACSNRSYARKTRSQRMARLQEEIERRNSAAPEV